METMIGANKKGELLVLADRKSRKIRLRKLRLRQARRVNRASQSIVETETTRSVTTDRGQEFSAHKRLSRKLGVPVYFCHPYISSERGTVETRIMIT